MKGRSWLQEHLEKFVKPYLGYIPTEPLVYFTPAEMTVIKNAWRSVRKASEGKILVLPGRDTFVFEILARREGFPTLFLPGCSRGTVKLYSVPENSLIVDTGFMGSIPAGLNTDKFKLLSHAAGHVYRMAGAEPKQIFPMLTGSRGIALKIESTPKYWQTGRALDGEVILNGSEREEFARAARLTITVYKDSSPSFINQKQPIGRRPSRSFMPTW